jgi:hypothetical protein
MVPTTMPFSALADPTECGSSWEKAGGVFVGVGSGVGVLTGVAVDLGFKEEQATVAASSSNVTRRSK